MSDGSSVPVVASFFPDLYAAYHVEHSCTFRQVYDFLASNWLPCLDKSAASMINFASYDSATALKAVNVVNVHALSLDLDKGGPEALAFTLRKLQADGLCFAWFTTHSHDPENGKLKFRIFVPFASPVKGSEYKRIFQRARRVYTKESDASVCDPSRRFYRNSYHPWRESSKRCGFVDGAALDPDYVLGSAFEVAAIPEGIREVSPEVLRKLSKRWQQSPKPGRVDLGDRLKRVLDGVPFAGEGERNKTAFDLCRGLVETYTDISAKAVSAIFRSSLERMALENPTGALQAEQIESMVERARESAAKARATGVASDRRQDDIAQCFANGRDHAYTQEEISEMASSLGVTTGQLAKCWIMQCARDYYFVAPGAKIIEACHESFANTSRVILAPAPIETYSPTETGLRLKTISEMLEAYSTPIREVRKSMIEQVPKIDLLSGTLTIPVCPLRPLTPKFDEHVDRWLRYLARDKYDLLCKWIHFVPALRYPLAMLVLVGKGSAGKSLLAKGLARLFWEGPETKLSDVLGSFNATVEKCPVVFADEHLPRDSRGKEPIAQLRELIQSTTRYSNQKHKAQVPVDGALRLIVAANSHKILKIDDELSGDDAPAFAERLFDLTIDDTPGRFLASIGGRNHIDKHWIQEDLLACHFAYLIHECQYQWEGRFGIGQDSTELANKLIVRGGSRAKVCELFVKYFKSGFGTDPNQLRVILDQGRGRYFVHIDFVLDNWDRVLRGQPPLSTYSVAQALEGLSLSRTDLLGDGARWYEIDLDKISTWARETGYAFNAGPRQA
jgi:Family of unknown function (DUF5906)